MPKYIDITGHKYGLLTPICVDHKDKWDEYWLCECDCGKQVVRGKSALRKGLTVSCGCDKYKRVSSSLKRTNRAETNAEVFCSLGETELEFIGRQLNAFLRQCSYYRPNDNIFMEDVSDEEYDALANYLGELRSEKEAEDNDN